MTAKERAERAARACSRGRASPRNVQIIQQEIEEHAADAAGETAEAALDDLYDVELALQKAQQRVKARDPRGPRR